MSNLKISLKDKQSNTLLPVTDASCVNDAEQGKSQAEINRMLLSNNSEVFYVRRVGDNLSHVSEVEAGTWLGGMGMSNGFAMCVFNKGKFLLLDGDSFGIVAKGQLPQYGDNFHGNNVSFSNIYDSGSTLPRAYVSETREQSGASSHSTHRCFAYKLGMDGTAELMQTIAYTGSAMSNYAKTVDWAIDRYTNLLYAYNPTILDSSIESFAVRLDVMRYNLPESEESSVSLSDADSLDNGIYTSFQLRGVLQGAVVRNGVMLVAWSANVNQSVIKVSRSGIAVYDLGKKQLLADIDLSDYLPASNGTGVYEIEGIDIHCGKIYATFHQYDENDANMEFVEINYPDLFRVQAVEKVE